MSVSAIRITYFQADKITGHGAQRQASPYRVTTYKGPRLGLVGTLPAVLWKLHELNSGAAANADQFENPTPGFFERLTRLRRLG